MAGSTSIGDLDLLAGLTAGKRALIAAMGPETRVFSRKIPIALEDDRTGKLYRIASGWAVSRRILSDGRSQITAIFLPGEIIGIPSLLSEGSLDLLEPREVISVQSIGRSRLLALAAEDFNVALWLLWAANEETRRREQWISVLSQGTALQKVAFLLLDLHNRLSHGCGNANKATRIPLAQREIAEHLGLTLPHVSRTLVVLRKCGAVSTGYGTIDIVDPGLLVESAAEMLEFQHDGLAHRRVAESISG